ncbi:hypothetical protein OJ996_01030 [Luteolibacter sp. GHJ8]|uniref:DUF4089 domain-containing protein n=1 Tax=Luteolibacter rhizosphaerae TaxID=2989719 RepID=A0ABT3FY12_9BACT|nr:hypothetical protein [Luteolibacter rhizosphaerae]MCW1912134.1 hypothetical protein [Luteolibacter rhizosphaerae]
MSTPPSFEESISAELAALEIPQGETLCNILRGLFLCLRDLNARLAALEEFQCAGEGMQAEPYLG